MRAVRRFASAVQWPLLGVLAMAALVLGWIGFRAHGEATGQTLGVLDAAYRSIQLFVLEFNAAEPPSAPLTLQIARVLAPAVAGYAAAKALAVLFRDEIDRLMLRWRRNHIIVCGHGSQGATLATSLTDSGRRVAVIDRDPTRRGAVPMITGDATDPAVLRSAGVRRAAHVVALCGSDEANAAVALAVRQVVGDRQKPITHVHVLDPRLCAVLRSEAIVSGAALEFFTVYEQGARTLLDCHPPAPLAGTCPRIAIIGLGRLGRSLLIEAVRRLGPIGIIAIDRTASSILEDLRRRRPGFGRGSELQVVDIDIGSPAFADAGFLTTDGICDIDIAYVCLSDESDSLSASLSLLSRIKALPTHRQDQPIEIVARITRSGGLADLITTSARDDSTARLHTFDLYRSTLDESLLTGATREAIAAALHREYLATQQQAGRELGSTATLQPWEHLSPEIRDSNRAAAAGIGTRLQAIDADLIPLAWGADPIAFTPAEIELISILEHRRWVSWKLAHKFRPGETSDFEKRTNPYLVRWFDLDEEARRWVRMFASALPQVLADAGQQVARLDRGLARSLHAEYLQMRLRAGDDPAFNPSMVPWDQLPDSLRASNRDQAAHIRVKLMALDYDIAPGESGTEFAFTGDQVETLSIMEHDRWMTQREADGWVLGDRKDAETRISPSMVPWDDLTEEMREIDREFVRSMPRLLATAGFRIIPDPGL